MTNEYSNMSKPFSESNSVARTNKQRMLVVTTLAPPNGWREGRKDEQTKNVRCHSSSPTYSGREGRKDEQTKNARCHNPSPT